jgi:hypothetical protein
MGKATDADISKPPADAPQSCSAVDTAAHVIALQNASKGTVAEQTDKALGRACELPKTFKTDEDMLAEQYKLIDAGGKPLDSFALKPDDPNIDLEKYVRNSVAGIEEKLGTKLNYMYLQDDSGKADVFLLGPRQTAQQGEKGALKACVAFDDTADNALNLSLRLPVGTSEAEASKVYKQRDTEAKLAERGIPVDATADEVKKIDAMRQQQIDSLRPQPASDSSDANDAAARQLERQKQAISIGLSPDSSEDDLNKAKQEFANQATAIKLGLNQFTPAADIASIQQQMDAAPNPDMNREYNLPAGTSRSDALAITGKWLADGDLIRNGIDPSLSAEQVSNVKASRQKRESEIQDSMNATGLSADDQTRLANSLAAVKLGLPEDTAPETVSATKDAYEQQASAVSIGLPRDSSAEAIDTERNRQSDAEIPPNLCLDVPPLK